MIRPAAFGSNPETQTTNAFQTAPPGATRVVHDNALAEFDQMVGALRNADAEIMVFDDLPEPVTPDAVFPNNWVSFHSNGDVYLYRMLAPSRRAEVRRDIVDAVTEEYGFTVGRIVDWSEQELALEGTGSLVLDHLHRVAYAALSPRTERNAVEQFCTETGFEAVCFDTVDAVYHTNVVMCVGTAFAVVCTDAIVPDHRERVLGRLVDSGRDVVEIDLEQMASFSGNMLEVSSRAGEALVVASDRAVAALRDDQRAQIERHVTFVTSPLGTIETYGGGSARCMLAEVFLPRG